MNEDDCFLVNGSPRDRLGLAPALGVSLSVLLQPLSFVGECRVMNS
jgi:hypothetical protein